jgi:hypothetical protein
MNREKNQADRNPAVIETNDQVLNSPSIGKTESLLVVVRLRVSRFPRES